MRWRKMRRLSQRNICVWASKESIHFRVRDQLRWRRRWAVLRRCQRSAFKYADFSKDRVRGRSRACSFASQEQIILARQAQFSQAVMRVAAIRVPRQRQPENPAVRRGCVLA